MSSGALRRDLVRIGALLYQRRYVIAAEGNLSVRLGGGRFLATAAGTCKGWLTQEELVEVDDGGLVLDGPRESLPTSEWRLHREIYSCCPEAQAVCHAHPPYTTACSAAGHSLDCCVLGETASLLGKIPLVRPMVAGTEELAAAVREYLPAARAMLLGNHGAVTWGADLNEAYFRMEYLERLAEVTLLGELAGGVRRLPDHVLPDHLAGLD